MSIEIASAVYRSDTGTLEVIATIGLGQSAGLQLDLLGPMAFYATSNQWGILIPAASGNPGVIIVSGVEGSENAATTVCINTCQGDLNDDGVVDISDIVLFRANFGSDCNLLPPEEI